MNQWDFDFYDKYMVKRFEIAYVKECLFGMTAKVAVKDSEDCLSARLEVTTCDGDEASSVTHCRSSFLFEERKQ